MSQIGSKSSNPDAVNADLASLVPSALPVEQEESNADMEDVWEHREPSPVSPSDALHYEYEIKRKTWAHNDVEEATEWTVVGPKYHSIEAANRAASEEVRRERDGLSFGLHSRDYRVTKDRYGMDHHFHSCEVGKFRVLVQRRLVQPSEGKVPGSKVGWVPKNVYDVRVVETVRAETGEGEEPEGDDEEALENLGMYQGSLYTSLEMANRAARRAMLRFTTDVDSARIDDALRRVAEEKRLEELVEGLNLEGKCFRETQPVGGKMVTVWVEERALRGARNP
jgi:hypothetical protein